MRLTQASRSLVMLVVFALVLLFPGFVSADQNSTAARPRIMLTELTSPAGDTVAKQLASTITSSLDLVMRLTGTLTVERADFLAPTLAFDRALQYYLQNGVDGAVFGAVAPAPGGAYTIDLEVWNGAQAEKRPTEVKQTISNLLASFDIADKMSLQVASTVVGRKLTEGRLVVKNVGGLSSYSVYADGHLLGRNRSEFRLLTGEREIIIAKPGALGDEPLGTFHVEIKQGETTTVALVQATEPEAVQTPTPEPTNQPAAAPAASVPTKAATETSHRPSSSPEAAALKRFSMGVNLGQTVTIAVLSKALSGGITLYIPVEIDAAFALSRRFALSGEFLYRLEQDGTYFNTQELGVALGPTYVSGGLRGFFATARVGLAYASGIDYNNEAYQRLDLLLQPEVGVFVPLPMDVALTVGLGMQSLVLISENPVRTWSWNALGVMSHGYLPVLDLSLGFEL